MPFSTATLSVHAGRTPDSASGALGAPIVQATAYAHDAVGVNRGHAYSRVSNPTVDALERALGAIEEAPPAVAFRSGCAAIAAVLLTLLRPGDEIVVSDVVYGGTVRLLRELLAEFGVIAHFVDTSNPETLRAALTPATKLVLIETPGNPTLKLTDVEAIATICKAANVPLAVDNTFLTPVFLRPLDLGADVVIYSTTKYQDGHGVSVGGAVLTRDEPLLARVRRTRKTLGSIQAPHEAWLTLQGLRTLDLRVRRHFENARLVAEGLAARSWVRTVTYPGLASFPQPELAAKLPAHGGVLVFELDGGVETAKAFLEEIRLVKLAEHLGSIETLATHPATMSHGDVPRAQREHVGIGDGLIRLSVGLESPADILRDLDDAYDRASRRIAAAEATIVLKFGSSILRTVDDLPTAVHEIYRFVRAGRRVVAVVSAIGDATDRLLSEATAAGDPGDEALAIHLATGEATSAALLGAALRRAGVAATVLDTTTLGLRTSGPTLDARPCSFDTKSLRAALDAAGVVVVPGFVGRDADNGRVTLLGRGGSDLSAAFIAERLGARECVLLKDVDGVYTGDPAKEGATPPRRYASVAPEEAQRVASPLVQPKAIVHAANSSLTLIVRRIGATHGSEESTTIRSGPSRLASVASEFRSLRVAVLGAGVVGGGVLSRLAALPELFDTCAVLTRDPAKALAAAVAPERIVDGFDAVLASRPDVVVELVGGIEPAGTWIERAIDAGISVVTANKALLARFGRALRNRAEHAGVELRIGAAVGGAAPVVERLLASRRDGLASLEAALSGTCNFVLDRVAGGATLADAVVEAQSLGLAERDPARDLEGRDLADKLALIAQWTWPDLDLVEVSTTGIRDIDVAALQAGRRRGERTVLVGRLESAVTPDGRRALRGRVSLERVDGGHPFAALRGSDVAAGWTDAAGITRTIRGAGAGRWPTTEAVIGDLFELRTIVRGTPAIGAAHGAQVRDVA